MQAAANRGDADGAFFLSWSYVNGEGVTKVLWRKCECFLVHMFLCRAKSSLIIFFFIILIIPLIQPWSCPKNVHNRIPFWHCCTALYFHLCFIRISKEEPNYFNKQPTPVILKRKMCCKICRIRHNNSVVKWLYSSSVYKKVDDYHYDGKNSSGKCTVVTFFFTHFCFLSQAIKIYRNNITTSPKRGSIFILFFSFTFKHLRWK